MMKNRKASKIGTAAAILASVFLSGTTVFGYAPMQTTEASGSVVMPVDTSFVDSEFQNNIFEYSNIYFETENHENISVNESDLEPRALICTHDFKSGYSDLHYPQSNGSCIVTVSYTHLDVYKRQVK